MKSQRLLMKILMDITEIFRNLLYQLRRISRFQWPPIVAARYLESRAKNPNSFNEKILYKIAHDRNHMLTIFADKLEVREYVASTVGEELLTRIYGVIESSEKVDLDLFDLPKNFVMKPNHASGAALIVADFVPHKSSFEHVSNRSFQKYYTSPDQLHMMDLNRLVKFWLDTSYYNYCRTGFPEWAYRGIRRKVFFEELLDDDGQPPEDFRFFTFNGKCEAIMVDSPGYKGVTRDIFSTNWKRMKVQLKYPNSHKILDRPEQLEQMIEIAEQLARGTDHIRVDLYNLKGRVLFGELTNYHAAGLQKFTPQEYDLKFGQNWNPDRIY